MRGTCISLNILHGCTLQAYSTLQLQAKLSYRLLYRFWYSAI